MTIHDELILELIKPNKLGEVGEGALIINIVRTKNIKYKLEEPTHRKTRVDTMRGTVTVMSPDITVTLPKEGGKRIAIELENDIQWDFGESLRQVKRYKLKFHDTRVIIPEEYKRFAPLYVNEGFKVYLWRARRRWQCLICGNITEKEEPIRPKCKKCNKTTEHRLIGLEDTEIQDYPS